MVAQVVHKITKKGYKNGLSARLRNGEIMYMLVLQRNIKYHHKCMVFYEELMCMCVSKLQILLKCLHSWRIYGGRGDMCMFLFILCAQHTKLCARDT